MNWHDLVSVGSFLGVLVAIVRSFRSERRESAEETERRKLAAEAQTRATVQNELLTTTLFVRVREYDIEKHASTRAFEELKYEVKELTDYVRGDQLPEKIALHVARAARFNLKES